MDPAVLDKTNPPTAEAFASASQTRSMIQPYSNGDPAMAVFTEHMQILTDQLRSSRQERGAKVTVIRNETAKFITDAQSLLKKMSSDIRTSAEQLKTKLEADRRRESEQLQAQRAANRQCRSESRKQVQEMLGRERSERQDKIHQMITGFQEIQQKLSSDLQEAGRVWRQATANESAKK